MLWTATCLITLLCAARHGVFMHRFQALSRYRALLARYRRPQWPRMVLLALILCGAIGVQVVMPPVASRFIDQTTSGAAGKLIRLLAELKYSDPKCGRTLVYPYSRLFVCASMAGRTHMTRIPKIERRRSAGLAVHRLAHVGEGMAPAGASRHDGARRRHGPCLLQRCSTRGRTRRSTSYIGG
jgi:hypothetical protein